MSVYIDKDSDISISDLGSSLSAYGIPFIDMRAIAECDVKNLSKAIISSFDPDGHSSSAAIFIGKRDFISKARATVSECLNP